ncbi:acyl dehydratase [Micromonospora sp. NPDC050200]|uniref:acyl dehydratase n=1 Tax=Micromonospora sp. NPDC050200 TaxID=3155664 RepID=UPI0033FAD2A4
MNIGSRRPDEISVGDRLPELRIPITRTLIVAGALATRDFEDVHHDPQRAIERGTPDTYMSINNTNGLVSRYVTDWAGPAARLSGLSTRLGVPNFPGDTMTLTGEVTAVDGDTITVAVTGANSKGAHATSKVTLRLSDPVAPRQPEVTA